MCFNSQGERVEYIFVLCLSPLVLALWRGSSGEAVDRGDPVESLCQGFRHEWEIKQLQEWIPSQPHQNRIAWPYMCLCQNTVWFDWDIGVHAMPNPVCECARIFQRKKITLTRCIILCWCNRYAHNRHVWRREGRWVIRRRRFRPKQGTHILFWELQLAHVRPCMRFS
jgi:hypothetical protein